MEPNQPRVFKIDEKVYTYKVISFDFAEKVHYPHSPQQVGSAYFKTPRKCGIFGIHNERTKVQHNILIDEADDIGKGANTVISCLDYYICENDSDILILFADNCRGQNKNNMMLQYLN